MNCADCLLSERAVAEIETVRFVTFASSLIDTAEEYRQPNNLWNVFVDQELQQASYVCSTAVEGSQGAKHSPRDKLLLRVELLPERLSGLDGGWMSRRMFAEPMDALQVVVGSTNTGSDLLAYQTLGRLGDLESVRQGVLESLEPYVSLRKAVLASAAIELQGDSSHLRQRVPSYRVARALRESEYFSAEGSELEFEAVREDVIREWGGRIPSLLRCKEHARDL